MEDTYISSTRHWLVRKTAGYSEHPVTMVLRRSTGSVWDTTAHSVYGSIYGCVKDLQCLKPTASACHRRKQNTSEFFLSSICFMYDMQRKDIYVFICKSATTPSSPQASFSLGCDPSPPLKPHFPWGTTPLLSSRLSTLEVRPLLTFCIWAAVAHAFCFCLPSVCQPVCPVGGTFSNVISGAVNCPF